MASLFVNGPAHIFLTLPAAASSGSTGGTVVGRTPQYLGTTISSPQVSFSPQYAPAMNEMAGVQKPMDFSYQGRMATVSGDFTRYNEAVFAACQTASPGGVRGFDSALDIGALMITEGYAPSLIMVHPFSLKSVYKSAGLPQGYTFVAAICDSEGIPQGGVQPKKVRLSWTCLPVLVPTAQAQSTGTVAVGAAGGNLTSGIGLLSYGWLLYTNTVPNGLVIN